MKFGELSFFAIRVAMPPKPGGDFHLVARSRKTLYRAASLLKLTAAARPAKPEDRISVHVVPSTGIAANSSATSAAPVVWPNRRAVACIPLAPPLRAAGAEVMIARLFGVLKNPN